MTKEYLTYVFRKGHCVRSDVRGLGQVIGEGEPLLVRFLDGYEARVPREGLRFVPDEEFEREILNRSAIETYLIGHVHGRDALPSDGWLWAKDAEGIWHAQLRPPRHTGEFPNVIQYFLPDDIGKDIRVQPVGHINDRR